MRATGVIVIVGLLAGVARADDDWLVEDPPLEEPPPPRLSGSRPIKGSQGAPGHVAFTFDDGPSWETTPEILDLLDEYEIKATFFVVGRRITGKGATVEKNREVLREIVRRGHMIGNHTFSHLDLTGMSTAHAIEDIEKSARAIEEQAKVKVNLFRPPFGRLTGAIRQALRKKDWVTVTWNIDPADTRERRPKTIRTHVVNEIRRKDGGIVILHDTKRWSVEAFRGILADLEAENCRRLAAGEIPLVPVELDWFAVDRDGQPVEIPEDVVERTEATRKRLETRCPPLDQKGASD